MNTKIFHKRWFIFTLERFPPLKHLLLILSLVGANTFVALKTTSTTHGVSIIGFLVVFIAFFRLRLFDEIKDYKTDCQINSHRPLARGLIPLKEAKMIAFSLILVELILSAIIGLPALISAFVYILYSLLMYKEFFLSHFLCSRLATYALTHTIVSSFIAFYIFSSVTGLYIWEAPISFTLFTIANWMIFNVFEFGRKTFGIEEEQPEVESYSKNFGPKRAAGYVLYMATIAGFIAITLGIHLGWPSMINTLLKLLLLPLIISAILYGKSNSTTSARAFRKSCSAFILLFNLIISIGLLI